MNPNLLKYDLRSQLSTKNDLMNGAAKFLHKHFFNFQKITYCGPHFLLNFKSLLLILAEATAQPILIIEI